METSAGDGHHEKSPALSDEVWYNLWPDSVPSPPKPNQNYIVPPLPPPLQSLFLTDSTVTVTITTATTTQPGLCPLQETQAKVWQRERGIFKTRFYGISPSGNGGPGGGGSRARMGSGSHRGERDGRCYTGKQCWDGEAGEAPAGVHLSRGKPPVHGPGSRTTSGCQGRRGAGTPRSSPAQIPALNHKPNNVTSQDAPIPLRAKPQHSSQGHQIPPSHQILPGHSPLSLLCPRPRPLLVKAL